MTYGSIQCQFVHRNSFAIFVDADFRCNHTRCNAWTLLLATNICDVSCVFRENEKKRLHSEKLTCTSPVSPNSNFKVFCFFIIDNWLFLHTFWVSNWIFIYGRRIDNKHTEMEHRTSVFHEYLKQLFSIATVATHVKRETHLRRSIHLFFEYELWAVKIQMFGGHQLN